MKMHFQKRFTKMIAFAMSAIIIISTMTVNVQASVLTTTGTTLSLEKVIDMALTKTGIVANNNFLQKTQASILNMLNGTASSYSSYCEANGLDKTEETWSQYLSSDAYISLGLQIPNAILQVVDVVTWMISPDTHSDEMAQRQAVVKAIADTTSCVQGETYSMSDEAVEFVRDTFDNVVKNEGIGYYYLPVVGVNYIDVDRFASLESYNNFKEYVLSSEHITISFDYIAAWSDNKPDYEYYMNNDSQLFIVRPYNNINGSTAYIYFNNWSSADVYSYSCSMPVEFPIKNSSELLEKTTNKISDLPNVYSPLVAELPSMASSQVYVLHFYGKENGQQIVFDNLTSLKEYTAGIRPYYSITNNIYDNSVDNSINFTGDYIVNNADKLSYDTVYNEIINQNDYSENVVNNIVNDNTQTIINNYYYTDPDGGGDSGDNEGSGGGLGALIDGIGSVLNFIVTLIGDALSLVTGFLDTIYTMLKNLGGSFTNFSGLLGELFTFIPQELIDLISASISVTIAVCLICLLKR